MDFDIDSACAPYGSERTLLRAAADARVIAEESPGGHRSRTCRPLRVEHESEATTQSEREGELMRDDDILTGERGKWGEPPELIEEVEDDDEDDDA